jgi:phage tail sheath protein FI
MDRAEGPQRAPANRPLRDVQALSDPVDDPSHDLLNRLGINVIRATPGRGIAPQGARTLSSDAEWRYLGVRRLLLMIAEAIEEGHQWAAFEPNSRVLRDAISHSLRAFLGALWSRGAFAGANPEAAFAIKCDEENNPPEVIDAGQLVAQIAVAPVRPYEFIKLRIGRTDRLQVQIQE